MYSSTAPLAPVIDTQKTLAYDQLFLCWRLPQDSAPAWHYSVEYQRREGGAAASWGGTRSPNSSSPWQRIDEVRGTSAVIDRLQTDSVYVLRVRGCNKAGFGEYSEDVYLHTPPAPGETLHGTAGLQPTDGFRWRSVVEKNKNKKCLAENMQGQEEPING